MLKRKLIRRFVWHANGGELKPILDILATQIHSNSLKFIWGSQLARPSRIHLNG